MDKETQWMKFEKRIQAGAEFIQTQAVYDLDRFRGLMEYAGRMIEQIKGEGICDGVHIMAIGREQVVPDIMAASGID